MPLASSHRAVSKTRFWRVQRQRRISDRVPRYRTVCFDERTHTHKHPTTPSANKHAHTHTLRALRDVYEKSFALIRTQDASTRTNMDDDQTSRADICVPAFQRAAVTNFRKLHAQYEQEKKNYALPCSLQFPALYLVNINLSLESLDAEARLEESRARKTPQAVCVHHFILVLKRR